MCLEVSCALSQYAMAFSRADLLLVGNYYSIRNDYDTPARIFFAQACEILVSPLEEEEEEEEDVESQ